MKLRCMAKKLNNSGSTLVTTMIAMMLLMVLATIVMSVSAMNYKTKSMDRKAKLNFYENERALDDIYNGIGQRAAECMGVAYTKVLTQISMGVGGIDKDEKKAHDEFCKEFVKALKSTYTTDIAKLPEIVELLNSYAIKSSRVTVNQVGKVSITYNEDGIPSEFVFERVEVQYTDAKSEDYRSIITTDIVIEMPNLRFIDENDEIFDYAMVANKGIYFLGADRDIEGNIYAGIANSSTHSADTGEKTIFGGINLYRSQLNFAGKFLVTRGAINVRQSTLNIDNGSVGSANVWAESIATTGGNGASEFANINIKGKTYIANDLEINARNSTVSMEGAYYGYNNGVYSTQESESLTGMSHTKYSAIIVNQKMAKLNLTHLNALIIAGKAYMDFGLQEQSTGESMALKSNQVMYMVPEEFMSIQNPTTAMELNALGITINDALNAIDIPETWFAYSLLRDGARVQSKAYMVDGTIYYYFFLNFVDEGAETYASQILNATQPIDTTDTDAVWKWKMKQRLQKRLFEAVIGNAFIDNISINTSSDTVIYGKGTIIGVTEEESNKAISLISNTTTVDKVTLMGEVLIHRFRWLYCFLNSKSEYPMFSDSIDEPDLSAMGYEDSTTILPLDSFVDMHKLSEKPYPDEEQTYFCGYRAIVSAHDVTISENFQGVVLSAGNVTINENCSVEGLVMAGGTIEVKGDGAIIANRSIVQTLLNEEVRKEEAKVAGSSRNKEFVITYLRNYTSVEASGTSSLTVKSGTDYQDYIVYRNWIKGEDDT